MSRSTRSSAILLLGLLAAGLLPSSCVDTSIPKSSATGGKSAVTGNGGSDNGSLGGTAPVGATANSCGDVVDTATDGTAGTTSTGPYVWKSVTIRGGGFVDGIVFSPVERGLAYARTDMGGAYRWDSAMNGWVVLTDWIGRSASNQTGIESIAADPVDANVVYMAAGTYLTGGNGVILRSTDRGATFAAQNIGVLMGGNTDGRSMGERLAIDPNLTSTLYFGSRAGGLMQTTDSGTTWTQVTSFPVAGSTTTTGTPLGLSFVLFDPKSGAAGSGSSTIYVGVADVIAGSNLYVSKDAGATWQLVAAGPTQQMPHHGALDASGMLYLAYNNGPGPNGITAGGIWKYDTATDNWSNVTPVAGAYGYGGVSVDATHPGTVIVSTLDWWNPDEIYRTTNGGTAWMPIGRTAKHNVNGAEWLRWGKPGCVIQNFAGWMGDIEIDPFDSAHVMYVTGQGVWASRDANSPAASNITWTFENRNLEQTAVIDMQASVNGAFLSCVGDIAGARNEDLDRPSPTGMYSNPVFGNCNSLDFAGSNPDIVVRAGTSTSATPSNLGGFSKDNGRTWKPFATLPAGTVTTGAGGRIAVSADGTTFVWTPPNTAPAYATDDGTTWTAVAGLPTGASVVADRQNPSKFYSYVSSAGAVYVSIDGGKSFAAAANTVALTARGARLRAVFGREGELWLTSNNALLHSTESGANFATVSGVQNAYALGFGKAATENAYPAMYLYGTIDGITGFFHSDDAGTSWTRINDDQHQFGTAGYIAGDENVYGRVYIGHNGRGIIYGDPKN